MISCFTPPVYVHTRFPLELDKSQVTEALKGLLPITPEYNQHDLGENGGTSLGKSPVVSLVYLNKVHDTGVLLNCLVIAREG